MATRKITQVKTTNSKVPYKVILECGHFRYVHKKPKVGDTFECTQKRCKWDGL